MYEKTLSIDTGNHAVLQHIDNKIASTVAELGGVLVKNTGSSRDYLAIAVPDTYTKQVNDLVVNLLKDIFSITYKQRYLLQYIKVNSDSFEVRTLINCMSIFDSEQDKKMLSKDELGSSKLAIDGFYNFRMKNIKAKWSEIAQLTNGNGDILYDKSTMITFIKYMIESISPISQLSVAISDDQYILFDKKDNIICNTNIPLHHVSVQELAMIDILLHNPNQLSIYLNTVNDCTPLLDMCGQLFSCKVYKSS